MKTSALTEAPLDHSPLPTHTETPYLNRKNPSSLSLMQSEFTSDDLADLNLFGLSLITTTRLKHQIIGDFEPNIDREGFMYFSRWPSLLCRLPLRFFPFPNSPTSFLFNGESNGALRCLHPALCLPPLSPIEFEVRP